jgi:hypothetical protein
VDDEKEMKKSGSNKAYISTDKEVKFKGHCKSAYLVLRDTDRDFAVFRLNKNEEPQPKYLDLYQCLPGVDRLDFQARLANQRAFSIGYNSNHRADTFPQAHEEVIKNISPDNRNRAETAPDSAWEFYEVFHPDRKTLSIGRLDSSQPGRESTFWKHRITGWHGISGSMIACLENSSTGGPSIQVLGMCKITPEE